MSGASRPAALWLTAALMAAVTAFGCGPSASGGDDDDDDDGSGAPDAGGGEPLRVIGRRPDRGADNVWVYDPILVDFSQPLDAATVGPDTIRLTSGSEPLAFDVALAPDGLTASATLSQPVATPAEVVVAVTAELRDERGQAASEESWSFELPVWQRIAPQAAAPSIRPALAIDASGAPLAAWIGPDGNAGVYRLETGSWRQLGGSLGSGQVTDVQLAVDDGDAPVLAWREAAASSVHRFDGSDWVELPGALPGPDGAAPALAIGADGQPVLAGIGAAGIAVLAWDGSAFAQLGPDLEVAGAGEVALVMDEAAPVVAAVAGGTLTVSRLEGGAWIAVGGGPADDAGASAPSVAASGGAIAVGWQDAGGDSADVLAARADRRGAWQAVVGPADLDVADDAIAPAIAMSADGVVHVTWQESSAGGPSILVARAGADAWEYLDTALTRADAEAALPVMAFDARGVPSVAWSQEGGVAAARWNDSPVLP